MSRWTPRRAAALAVSTFVVALLASCSDDGTQPTRAVGVTVVSGDGQSGPADAPLPELVVARVVDTYGDLASRGIRVQVFAGAGTIRMTSEMAAGNGSVLRSPTLGEARVRWTLGASGPQQLRFFAVDASGDTLNAMASATLTAGG